MAPWEYVSHAAPRNLLLLYGRQDQFILAATADIDFLTIARYGGQPSELCWACWAKAIKWPRSPGGWRDRQSRGNGIARRLTIEALGVEMTTTLEPSALIKGRVAPH